jgi:hypothetical protein
MKPTPLCAWLVFAAILSLLISGCDGDDGSSTTSVDVSRAICHLRQAAGDVNCDGTIDYDSDGDGIPDPYDRFQGVDTADQDHDGFANWADPQPYQLWQSPQTSQQAPQLPPSSSPQDATQIVDQQLQAQAQQQAEENARLQVIIDAQKQEQARWEAMDSDSDTIPDVDDPQPYLDYLGDDDNDGTSNGHDLFPLNDGFD